MSKVKLNHVASQFDDVVVHRLQNVEHLDNGSWSEPWHTFRTLDGKGLSRSCLSVSENANIVSINSTLDQTFRVFKDFFLSAFTSKDRIEVVIFGSSFQTNCD